MKHKALLLLGTVNCLHYLIGKNESERNISVCGHRSAGGGRVLVKMVLHFLGI